jgi:hypothetical protein
VLQERVNPRRLGLLGQTTSERRMPTLATAEFPHSRNWDELEALCWDLFRTEWNDPNAVRHGRLGQRQNGVDMFGRRQGRGHHIGVQCKLHGQHASLTLPEIRAEVHKAEGFQPRLDEFVVATTAPRDARLQRAVRLLTEEREASGRFGVYVRFWEDLSDRLALDGVMARRHYPQFFISTDASCPPVADAQDAIHPTTPAHVRATTGAAALRVFVSSRMDAGLEHERVAVAEAVEGTGIARAWYWERDGQASPGRYTDICVQEVLASDGLVLILCGDLSPRVRREYKTARDAGRPCYIFMKEDCQQDIHVRRFVDRQRRSLTMRNFQNISELRSHVVESLADEVARSWRERRATIVDPARRTARRALRS